MKITNDQLIFNKYKIKKKINQSLLSIVYEGINIKDNEPVAIKIAKRKEEEDLLMKEAFFLFDLKGFGIPKMLSFGKKSIYNILVEEFLGLSLFELWDFTKQKDMKIKNVCMIALQALNRLEFIHSKNIIHGDIKPSNFLIGRKDKEIIYLIDFGLSHKYRSSRTGKHIKPKKLKLFIGSMLFSSINAFKGYIQTRRNDLESLGYMLIYLVFHYLPWSEICNNKKINQALKIKLLREKKNSITSEELCNGLPEEFTSFIKYCRNLEFEQDPDYDYLKSLFTNILFRNYPKQELFFFWVNNKHINKRHSNSVEITNSHYKKIKSSVYINLYNKIKKSLEENKKNEIKNPNDNKLIMEHRDIITINDEAVRNDKNKNINKNIGKEVCAKKSNNYANKTNNKKFSIKVNTKNTMLNNKKNNNKKITHKINFSNGKKKEINLKSFTTIKKINNFNIKLSNDIDYRKFSFGNRINGIYYEKKLYDTSNNILINNIQCKSFIGSAKKKENKKIILNILNTYEKNNNRLYRALKERETKKEKDMNNLIIQQSINSPKNITLNNNLFEFKKKNEIGLNFYDKFIYNNNIINNKICLTRPNSECLSFKNNLKYLIN